jgi:hypothetical protein
VSRVGRSASLPEAASEPDDTRGGRILEIRNTTRPGQTVSSGIEKAIIALVYASVVLGVIFLLVLRGISGFPGWLFYSIMAGEGLWIICAVGITRRARWAPYMALLLAIITLAVSLPQPTHYSFAESGQIFDFAIFAGGAVLQVALVIAIAMRFVRSRGNVVPSGSASASSSSSSS